MTTEQEKLKPCPFCGGEVQLETVKSRAGTLYGVVCRNTGNRGGTCCMEQVPSRFAEAAIARWNMRKPEEALRAEIERLEASDNEGTELCDCLSGLLGSVAVAVRGSEERKSRHGFADIPSRVKTVVAERDQLKAEIEALRKALSECIQSLSEEMLSKYHQAPEDMHPSNKRRYDLEMEELAGYRAAMAKEAGQ